MQRSVFAVGIVATVALFGCDAGGPATSDVVHALDARSGRELWVVSVVGDPSAPAVIGGRVFVGTDLGRVIAIGGTEVSSTTP